MHSLLHFELTSWFLLYLIVIRYKIIIGLFIIIKIVAFLKLIRSQNNKGFFSLFHLSLFVMYPIRVFDSVVRRGRGRIIKMNRCRCWTDTFNSHTTWLWCTEPYVNLLPPAVCTSTCRYIYNRKNLWLWRKTTKITSIMLRSYCSCVCFFWS